MTFNSVLLFIDVVFLGGTESESGLVVLVVIRIVFKVVEENRVGLEFSVENFLSS